MPFAEKGPILSKRGARRIGHVFVEREKILTLNQTRLNQYGTLVQASDYCTLAEDDESDIVRNRLSSKFVVFLFCFYLFTYFSLLLRREILPTRRAPRLANGTFLANGN